MKHFFAFVFLLAALASNAQIVCIFCYDQNAQISQNVNNFIVNGGFENTTCAFNSNNNTFCPNSANYNCDIANWLCTGGGSNTYACFYDSNYWYVAEGTHSPYFGNSFCPACSSGDTMCLVNTDCETTGISPGYPINAAGYGGAQGISLEQTVGGLTVGATYVLEFWVGGESYGGGFPDPGMFAVDIGFGYTYLRCPSTPAHIGLGRRYLIEFNATSTSHTVKFTNWGHVCNTCTELVLDDVRLYTLAELSPNVPPCAGANVTVLFTAPNHICPGTCTDFVNLSVNATSFQWIFQGANPSVSNDVSPTNICYNTPGSYPVTLIGTNGITGDTLTLNNYITVYPYPPPQGILQSGDTLFANPGAVSYQWYHDGVLIPGATNYFYIATEGGDYNIVATDVNNCEVEAVIYDVIAGTLNPGSVEEVLLIYPDPVSGFLSFLLPKRWNTSSTMEMIIYNPLGEIVFRNRPGRSDNPQHFPVHFLPPSVYVLEVKAAGMPSLRKRFTKQ